MRPLRAIVLIKEIHDEYRVNEVDEGVAHVAVVLEVNRQVEEVVVVALAPINRLQQHLLRVLVRDVLDHDRSPLVLPTQDAVNIEHELVLFAYWLVWLHECCLLHCSRVVPHAHEAKVADRAADAWYIAEMGLRVLLQEHGWLDLVSH